MTIRRAIALLIVSACADDPYVVDVGVTDIGGGHGAVLDVPGLAVVGEAFSVRVTTYGGGCISMDRTEVTTTRTGASIRPLDKRYIPRENEACTADLRLYEHEASLRFETTGDKAVDIHGRRQLYVAGERIDEPVIYAFTVSVVE